jgi:hypothetical protein
MMAAAAAKNDLLIKDELDPVVDASASAILLNSLKSEQSSASFKNSDNNGDIKDEFTDEMEEAVLCCEENNTTINTDEEENNGGGSGDQAGLWIRIQ